MYLLIGSACVLLFGDWPFSGPLMRLLEAVIERLSLSLGAIYLIALSSYFLIPVAALVMTCMGMMGILKWRKASRAAWTVRNIHRQ